jgi:hypothetical protein
MCYFCKPNLTLPVPPRSIYSFIFPKSAENFYTIFYITYFLVFVGKFRTLKKILKTLAYYMSILITATKRVCNTCPRQKAHDHLQKSEEIFFFEFFCVSSTELSGATYLKLFTVGSHTDVKLACFLEFLTIYNV